MSTSSKARTGGAAGLLFVALFWNGILGVFFGVIGTQAWSEHVARTEWATTEGTVTVSKVASHSGENGRVYGASVQYSFEANGRMMKGDRASFFDWRTSSEEWAQETIADLPVGETVTVHFDPENPSESVLLVSGETFPAIVLLFLLPFQAIGLGLISLFLGALRGPDRSSVTYRYVHVDDPDHFVMRKRPSSFGTVFLGSLAVLSFVSILSFVLIAGMARANRMTFPLLIALTAASIACAVWAGHRAKRPKHFLHVNQRARTFAYPADEEPTPLDDIQSLVTRSEKTGTTINDVVQWKHSIIAHMEVDEREIFRTRGAESLGAELQELIEDRTSRGAWGDLAAQSAAEPAGRTLSA